MILCFYFIMGKLPWLTSLSSSLWPTLLSAQLFYKIIYKHIKRERERELFICKPFIKNVSFNPEKRKTNRQLKQFN